MKLQKQKTISEILCSFLLLSSFELQENFMLMFFCIVCVSFFLSDLMHKSGASVLLLCLPLSSFLVEMFTKNLVTKSKSFLTTKTTAQESFHCADALNGTQTERRILHLSADSAKPLINCTIYFSLDILLFIIHHRFRIPKEVIEFFFLMELISRMRNAFSSLQKKRER